MEISEKIKESSLRISLSYPTQGLSAVKAAHLCQLFAKPHGYPQSMDFSKAQYWGGCSILSRRIFSAQGLNTGLPAAAGSSLQLSHQGDCQIHQGTRQLS